MGQLPLVSQCSKCPADVRCIPNPLFSHSSFIDLHFSMCLSNANANSTKPLIVSIPLYLYLHPSSAVPFPASSDFTLAAEHASTSLIGSVAPLVSVLPSLSRSLTHSGSLHPPLPLTRVEWRELFKLVSALLSLHLCFSLTFFHPTHQLRRY